MAAKDTAPYLKDCLESICSQSYQNWELIAVNDHSTDETEAILQSYAKKDSRIRVFNSRRKKLIPSLKEGYKHVRGELINRMDSDDKMPADKLESLVGAWLDYGKGHVIAGGTEHFVEQGEVGGGFLRYEAWLNEIARTGNHYQHIYQECVIPSHSWITHREDFEAVGGFNPEVYPEDYDLCFRFYAGQLTVIGIDKVLHFWRDRNDRISRTWEEYKDNRYFSLKLRYFFQLDRKKKRVLIVWGAGRNGKDFVKALLSYEKDLVWVCDNERKIGKDIYGIRIDHYQKVFELKDPQILLVLSSPHDKAVAKKMLNDHGKKPVLDYWFFL